MVRSAGAIVLGYTRFDPNVNVAIEDATGKPVPGYCETAFARDTVSVRHRFKTGRR